MVKVNNLVRGYKEFYQKYFVQEKVTYKNLSKNGQSPKTLVISCSDSRVDPSILTSAEPGEIFVIRNVANIVPPFEKDEQTYHGTSAAIEFAIKQLQVENIIILAHSDCAGVKAAFNEINKKDFFFLNKWVEIINPDNKVISLNSTQNEQNSLITSYKNIHTFPWVKQRVDDDILQVYAWYFSIDNGKILQYNETENIFTEIAT